MDTHCAGLLLQLCCATWTLSHFSVMCSLAVSQGPQVTLLQAHTGWVGSFPL